MSVTTTSISFKGVEQDRVVAALASPASTRNCFVSPVIAGWVTVFDEGCEYANEPEIIDLARTVCGRCGCPAVAFAVIQSTSLFYWMFDERGGLEDRSFVDEGRRVPRALRRGLGGEPERLARLARPGVTSRDVREALERRRIFPEENLDDLCDLLGIYHFRLLYRHLDECWDATRNAVVWYDDPAPEFVWQAGEEPVWPDYVRIRPGRPSGAN